MLIVLVGVGWLKIIGFPHVIAGVEPLLFQRRDLIFQGGRECESAAQFGAADARYFYHNIIYYYLVT